MLLTNGIVCPAVHFANLCQINHPFTITLCCNIRQIRLVKSKKAAKVIFGSREAAEQAKTASRTIFEEYPDIKVRFGREKKEEAEVESVPVQDETDFSSILRREKRAHSDDRSNPQPDPIQNSESEPFVDYEPVDLFGGGNQNKIQKMDAPVDPRPAASFTRTITGLNENPFGVPASQQAAPSGHNPFGKQSTAVSSDEEIVKPPVVNRVPNRLVGRVEQADRNTPSPEPGQQSSIASFMKKKGQEKKTITRTSDDLVDIDLATRRLERLESRDKEVRQLISEIRDGAQVGLCIDLCSEKERYRRWIQQDISVFELDENGKVCERKCLKAYQRSAADQEESLPHELRPAETLVDCCWYLCAELCTTNNIYSAHGIDVWYDFMWKRTRAIRKDITQQHLACKKTAHVLEVVGRYHIWCAHALATEDRAVFNSSINNENLEKTMTSIEQAYQDLSYKNQNSEAEAEFRAYMIYMSLNETNVVMKHLSRVPKQYQKSG